MAISDARLFVREHFFRPPRRAAQDDAALRGADEVDEVLHFGARQRPILLDLLQRARGVQLRLQQVAERRASASSIDLGREAAAHQADRVDAENARRPAADRPRKRQRVLGDHRVAADERRAGRRGRTGGRRSRR